MLTHKKDWNAEPVLPVVLVTHKLVQAQRGCNHFKCIFDMDIYIVYTMDMDIYIVYTYVWTYIASVVLVTHKLVARQGCN